VLFKMDVSCRVRHQTSQIPNNKRLCVRGIYLLSVWLKETDSSLPQSGSAAFVLRTTNNASPNN